jgi:hypothetical protein
MKHITSFAVGAAFFVGYLWLTQPTGAAASGDARGVSPAPVKLPTTSPQIEVPIGANRTRSAAIDLPLQPDPPGTVDASPTQLQEQLELSTLRNAIGMSAFAEAAQQRALDACAGSGGLAGPQQVRFSVQVDSAGTYATLRDWKFEEIVDGEVPAPTFAACAELVLQGTSLQVVPQNGATFPTFNGRQAFMYRMVPIESIE